MSWPPVELTREEQLFYLSLIVFALGIIWLSWARVAARRSWHLRQAPGRDASSQNLGMQDLGEPLLDVEERSSSVGGAILVKSRVPLACRQGMYYALCSYFALAATVYLTRYVKGHGPTGENRKRLLRAGADLTRMLAWLLASAADATEYKSSDRSRNSLLGVAFAMVSALCAWREIGKWRLEAPSVWALGVHSILIASAIGSSCWPHPILRLASIHNPPSEEEKAVELYEIVGFTWLKDVFQAKKKQKADEKLDEKHLPRMMQGDTVAATWPALKELIEAMHKNKEHKNRTKFQKTMALFYTLVALTKAHVYAAGIIRFFYVFSGYLQPLALYIILKKFGQDVAIGWVSVGLLFFGPVLNAVLDSLQMFVQRRVATRCRGAIFVLLYEKGMKLDLSAGGGRVGDVVALMSADVQNVLTAVAYMHWAWGPLLQLCITLGALFWLVGAAALGALAVMFLNSIANGRIFKSLTTLNKNFLAARSKRMELVTEMLQGARIIKMLSFEKGIFDSVQKRRSTELAVLKKLLDCFVWIFTLINSTPPLSGAATFILLAAALGRRFDAAEGFTALTLLDNLRFVLLQAPACINYLITGYSSLQRIEEFLDAPEVDPKPTGLGLASGCIDVQSATFKWGRAPSEKEDTKDTSVVDGAIEESKTLQSEDVEEAQPTEPSQPTIRDITLSVKPGSLVLCCGITGGGKSSLLASLVGEIHRLEGTVRVSGFTAYCPQSAWCQNATIRDNICFGSQFNEERFNYVIEACALDADLAALPAGDATEVGERGITLSGGQLQRVALARAVYQDADIYILDDPLSAVDAHVGEHLFSRVVEDALLAKGKTVVLATHQISVALRRADHVIILSVDGTVAAQGTLDEIEYTPRGQELFAELAAAESDKKNQKAAEAKKAKEKEKETDLGVTGATKEAAGPPKKSQADGRLVAEEERKTGAPAYKVFSLYVSSAGAFFLMGSALFICQQPIKYVQSAALTKWIARMEKGAEALSTPMWLYLLWTAVFVAISLVAVILQNLGALRASERIHARLAWAVIRSPISWFDRSPVGRVQNRFSTDIQAVDRNVSNAVVFVIRGFVAPIVSLYAIGTRVWWLLPCFIPVLVCAFQVARDYLIVARDLKRIDSTTKSPVYQCFNESLVGLSTLRAFDGSLDRFKAKFAGLVDRTNAAELTLFAANFHLSVRLNALGATVTGLTSLVLYAQASTGHGLNSAFAGLVLSYAVSFTSSMIMLLRTWADLEIALNSCERVLEYLELEQEDKLHLGSDQPRWLIDTPAEITFENVSLRYKAQPEPALRSLSMVIKSGESLGVAGRTGSGKSTLLQSIVRLYPLEAGRIIIDGIDISTVGLRTLRGRISIVPQEPTLFSGSVRYNLDMFNERTEEELLEALAQSRGSVKKATSSHSLAGIGGSHNSLASIGSDSTHALPEDSTEDEVTTELGLDYELQEFGNNLSVGEKQLLCLARAIARKSKLVMLDEATANIDNKTDRRIQDLLRVGSLSKATRITIAHRLKTIIYCDRVAILSLGQLKELDQPSSLLNDTNSMFYKLCEASGGLDRLLELAKRADAERH